MTSATRTTNIAGDSLLTYARLLKYLKPLWFVFLISIFGFAIFAVTNPWFADLTGQLVDAIESGEGVSSEERLRIPLTLILIVILRGLGGFLGAYYMAYIANHVIHRIRSQIMGRFVKLPARFYDRSTTGHLMSVVTFNVQQVSAAVSDALTVILREGLTVVGLTGYMLYLNWKLTLIFLAVTPIISVVVLYASKKFRKHSNRIQISMGDVTHILSETIKGFKVIRSFGAGRQVEGKFNEASERNLRQTLKLQSVANISTPIIQTLVATALALLLWFALSPQTLGDMTTGELVAFVNAAGLLLKPIRQLSSVNAAIQRGLAAAVTIFDLLDEEEESDKGTFESAGVRGKVAFRHVSFSYPSKKGDNQPVLHDINFECEPGQKIAIVGKSGSGKSTLVNLIPRFYELDQGQILIDDTPHTDFTLENLRRQIALVSQQVTLFNGTIRDNITYGELADKDENEIMAALRNAHAIEFIENLPAGLDTRVGDDATLLSGGQRQRLAIARALLKDAPILILDEATSALDSESEHYIQEALEVLMQGRTTFVIAHRLSTIEKADRILVMQDGRIVESGSHQDLLSLNQHYSLLYQLQFTES